MQWRMYKNKYRIESTRLQNWNYSWPAFYSVTICTKNMDHHFGEIINGQMVLNECGRIVDEYWRKCFEFYDGCKIDEYVVMPNHFHGIMRIVRGDTRTVETIHELSLHKYRNNDICARMIRRKMILPKFIGRFKMKTAKMINEKQNVVGRSVWQSRYYDKIIHTEEELERVRHYIRDNPEKWWRDRNNL